MKISDIETKLNALNAKAAPAKAKKQPAAAPAVKTNGTTHLTQDELLRVTAQRIVDALNLTATGVTADILVESVHKFEEPYEGVVQ